MAGGVLILSLLTLATGWWWLLVPLAYGFWARVLTGPTLSPLGWTAQNVIAPRLGARRPVPGAPKRFAQAVGTVFSTAALVLGLLAGAHTAAGVAARAARHRRGAGVAGRLLPGLHDVRLAHARRRRARRACAWSAPTSAPACGPAVTERSLVAAGVGAQRPVRRGIRTPPAAARWSPDRDRGWPASSHARNPAASSGHSRSVMANQAVSRLRPLTTMCWWNTPSKRNPKRRAAWREGALSASHFHSRRR